MLVRASIVNAPLHQEALTAIESRYAAGVELWISRQVLREYLATLSRPQTFAAPVAMRTLIDDVRRFQARFLMAEEGPAVTANLLMLLGQVAVGGRQVHDANIVAVMLTHGVRRLLTHNTADFARYSAFIDVVPLVPAP